MSNCDFNLLSKCVISYFESQNKVYITEKTLQNEFGAHDKLSKEVLFSALKGLVKSGELVFISGKFALPSRAGLIKGTVRRNERGFGFFIADNAEECPTDLFLTPDRLKGIYQGDRVFVRRLPESVGKGDGCEVLQIIERGARTVTGVCRLMRTGIVVSPDDSAFGCDIAIVGVVRKGRENFELKNGVEVLCEIISYPEGKSPQGKILKILGDSRDYKVREECILLAEHAPEDFSAKVLSEVAKIPSEPQKSDFEGRADFTRLKTFTIDGDDSRDFDDAISIKKLRAGAGYELYVHIADVSHYVNAGGALDKEAFSRGCSIYLPDRVIPMLPEKLSNGLCSLNPGVKRLAISVKLLYDKEGNLKEKSFYRSIIGSNARLTYKKVQAFFDGEEQALKELSSLKKELSYARELMNLLHENRRKKGAIDLESSETKVYYENGELMVEGREQLESERLIEEFMIAANVAVAEYLYFLEAPCIYRVHENPASEKLAGLAEFLKAIGLTPQWRGDKLYSNQLQRVLDEAAKNEDLKYVAMNAALRAMQKAYYSPEKSQHFGLNEKYYCHFTSPIRRYPDLFVHRVLKAVLCGKIDQTLKLGEFSAEAASNSSELEKRAEKIERAVCDVYVCKFMSQFLSDYFEGIISGVNSFGFFVRLENTAEGLVRIENLPRGDYVYDEKTCSLKTKKHNFSVGKRVLVKLVSADISSGKLSFFFEGLL